MKQKIIVMMASAILMVGFQNCGKVKFTPSEETALVAKSDVSDSDVSDEDEVVDVSDDSPSDDSPADDKKPCDKKKKEKESDLADVSDGPGEYGNYDDEAGDNSSVICILAGSGKSVRLGLISEALSMNGQTPNTVCMSEKACLEIAAEKFEVKSAEKRGFCNGHNPHVAHLSDDEMKAKVDALK